MDTQTKRAIYNLVILVESLKSEQTITRQELIDRLRRRVPADNLPSEAELRHAYRHLILNAGIKNAQQVVTYRQAAKLADTTVAAIRQAVYRKNLTRLTVYRHGREWSGVTLRSLAAWRNWSLERFEAAARAVKEYEGVDSIFPRSEPLRVRVCVRRVQSASPQWERWHVLRPSDTPAALAQAECPQVRGDVVLDIPADENDLPLSSDWVCEVWSEAGELLARYATAEDSEPVTL